VPSTDPNPRPSPSPNPPPKPSPDSRAPGPKTDPTIRVVTATDPARGPGVIVQIDPPRYLSGKEVADYAYKAGFRGQALVTAIAIAGAESSWYTGAFGPEQHPAADWMYLGGNPRGLWQIIPSKQDSEPQPVQGPYPAGKPRPVKDSRGPRDARRLFDPAFNAQAAYVISNGGTNWKPWSTYTTSNPKRSYRRWIDKARGAAAEVGQLPVPGVPVPPGADPTTSNGVPVVDPDWVGGTLYPLRIGGAARPGELGTRLVGGTYDASAKQPSQLTIELEDRDLNLLTTGKVKAGTRIDVNTERFTVVQAEVVNGPAGAHVSLTALPSGVVELMHTDPPTMNNVLPFDYVLSLARAAGLSMVDTGNRGVGGRQTIEPKVSDATGEDPDLLAAAVRALNPYAPLEKGQRRETGWDIITRLARQYGNEVFLVGTSLYWAPVTPIVSVTVPLPGVTRKPLDRLGKVVQVDWPGRPRTAPAGALRALDVPRVRLTNPSKGRAARAIVSMQLAPEHRWAAVVGEHLDLGVGPLLSKTTLTPLGVERPTFLRVTRVSWPVADLTGPVTIEGETAVDAVKLEDETDAPDDGEDKGGKPGPVGSTPTFGAAANGAGQGWTRAGAMVTRKVPGSKVQLTVARDAGDLFMAFCAEFHHLVESLVPGICGGYVNRPIAGTNTWSNHAYGIAVDLNWTRHPQHRRGTFSESEQRTINSLCTKYQMYWGGNWSTAHVDEMHFECALGPSAAKRLGARLLAQL
jgi:hypothetical protein